MKATKRLNWLLVAGVLTGVSAPVMAQNQGRSPSGLMGVLDRNGNGKLEPEEIDLAVASLRKLDKNKDGDLSEDELRPDLREHAQQLAERATRRAAWLVRVAAYAVLLWVSVRSAVHLTGRDSRLAARKHAASSGNRLFFIPKPPPTSGLMTRKWFSGRPNTFEKWVR